MVNSNCLLLRNSLQKNLRVILWLPRIYNGYRKLDSGFTDLRLDSDIPPQELNDLALEIQRSLDYVESYYGIPPISTLAVIPIPSHTESLLNHLNENLSTNSRIMDISTILEGETILTDKTQAYCATVIGATLRHQVSDT